MHDIGDGKTQQLINGTHSPESISVVSIDRAGLSKPFSSCRFGVSDDVADDGRDPLLIEVPKKKYEK